MFTQHKRAIGVACELTTSLLVSLHFTQVFVAKYMALCYLTMLLENIKTPTQTHSLELLATAMVTKKEMDFHQTIKIICNITNLLA